MDFDNKDRNDEVYSKVVRAGKRTYFIDVKSTRGNDLYITLTESKKTGQEGNESFQKHKIFLYKEDFEKFQEGLSDVFEKIAELKEGGEYNFENTHIETATKETVNFEDLN